MKAFIIVLVALFLFVNVSSAEFYNPHEIPIIIDVARENAFPERITTYEKIVDIVYDYLFSDSDSINQSQKIEINSISLLAYTEVPQYCVVIIIDEGTLEYATIYIDANTLEVISISPEDYRAGESFSDHENESFPQPDD